MTRPLRHRFLLPAVTLAALLSVGCSSTTELTAPAIDEAVETPAAGPTVDADEDAGEPESSESVESSETVEPEVLNDNNEIPRHGCADGTILVACTSPHDSQNYAVFDSTSETYDPNALSQECYPYFLEFAGTQIGESGLSGESWYPDPSQWDDGRREIRCVILFDQPVTASLPELDLAAGFDGRIPWASLTADMCVGAYSDIGLVSVQTRDCTGDELIDILGLVDADAAIEQCQLLAVDAGADNDEFIESSWLLEARGFAKSICYRDLAAT